MNQRCTFMAAWCTPTARSRAKGRFCVYCMCCYLYFAHGLIGTLLVSRLVGILEYQLQGTRLYRLTAMPATRPKCYNNTRLHSSRN